MLNEAPKRKKVKDYSNPNAWELFWRIQWECFRRSVTPYLMYLFMSLLCLVTQLAGSPPVKITLGIICIVGGAFFNAHLCYHYGKMHYGSFVAGELHRRNIEEGISSGGDHRPEREFRFWKGTLIGFYVALPVIVLGAIAGAIPRGSLMAGGGMAYYALAMFAGWAIIPITWFGQIEGQGLIVSPYYSILFALLPIVVSTVAYLVGAYCERRNREREEAREQAVLEAGEEAKERVRRIARERNAKKKHK